MAVSGALRCTGAERASVQQRTRVRVAGLCAVPSPLQAPLRAVTVTARRRSSPVTEGLASILRDELKIEKERYRTPEAVLEGPPGGYELEDRPACSVLLLSRSFGDEEVFVEVDLDAQREDDEMAGDEDEDEEADEDDGELAPVTFTVNIVKGGRVLAFSCETEGEDVAIAHVSLSDTAGGDSEGEDEEDEEDDDYPPYTGPLFTELDDTLQQAFTDYLEERGINADFGAYLVELVHDKLEVEYMGWLRRVQDFVDA